MQFPFLEVASSKLPSYQFHKIESKRYSHDRKSWKAAIFPSYTLWGKKNPKTLKSMNWDFCSSKQLTWKLLLRQAVHCRCWGQWISECIGLTHAEIMIWSTHFHCLKYHFLCSNLIRENGKKRKLKQNSILSQNICTGFSIFINFLTENVLCTADFVLQWDSLLLVLHSKPNYRTRIFKIFTLSSPFLLGFTSPLLLNLLQCLLGFKGQGRQAQRGQPSKTNEHDSVKAC